MTCSCRLGWDVPLATAYWDATIQKVVNRVSTPSAREFLQWVKRHIIAGRAVMIAVRLYQSKDWYDHLIPLWGVCSTNISATAPLLDSDAFSLSTDLSVRTKP